MTTPSKSLPPLGLPFFPSIFLSNQFRTTPVPPPASLDLTSRTALVTGSNQGLGLEVCRQLLARKLSHLILCVRTPSKGEAAAETLRKDFPGARVEVMGLDMASYSSIQDFVRELEGRTERLDLAILNAGVRKQGKIPELVEGTGHEETFQVNYLSTVLLAVLMLPLLKRKSPRGELGRLTIVGSGLAFAAKFPNKSERPLIPSFDLGKWYEPQERYNVSKLLGMMFLWELEERIKAEDGVVVNLVDPGFVAGTNLTTGLSWAKTLAFEGFKKVAARKLEVGGWTYVDAAVVKGRESHGCFLMSWKISPFVDMLYTPEGKVVRERLWKETMEELSFANLERILEDMKKN